MVTAVCRSAPDGRADGLVGRLLRDAVHDRFPPADGTVVYVPPVAGGVEAVICFTGYAVVITELKPARLVARGIDAFGGAAAPAVLLELAGPRGEIDVLDTLLATFGTGRTGLPERHDLDAHRRVRLSRRWRENVHVHGDDRGLVTIGTGIGGLPELSFEVEPGQRGRGVGRALLVDALGLVPEGEPVLLSAAPGNARSVRAALAAGFVPIGSVQLVRPGRLG